MSGEEWPAGPTVMSVLPPIADIVGRSADVCKVPEADLTAIPIGLVVATHEVLAELQLAYRRQLTVNLRSGTMCLGSIRNQVRR